MTDVDLIELATFSSLAETNRNPPSDEHRRIAAKAIEGETGRPASPGEVEDLAPLLAESMGLLGKQVWYAMRDATQANADVAAALAPFAYHAHPWELPELVCTLYGFAAPSLRTDLDANLQRGEVTWPRRMALRHLAGLGEQGRQYSAALEQRFTEAPVSMGAEALATAIASAIWVDVMPEVIRRQRNSPGITIAMFDEIRPALAPKQRPSAGEASVERSSESPLIELAVFNDACSRGALSTKYGILTLMWIPCRVYDAWVKRSDRYHVIEVTGPEEIAEELGLKSHSAHEGIIEALEAGARWQRHWPTSGRKLISLWGLDRQLGGNGRKAKLRLEVHTPLLPEEGRALPKNTTRQRTLRRIMPILRTPPPLPGRLSDHAPALRLHFDVLAEFARRVEQYNSTGVLLADHALDRWAGQVGLDADVRRLVDLWCDGSAAEPPFLERVDRDRYRLAPGHGEADRSLRYLDAMVKRGREMAGRAWDEPKKGRR
jgi:hypothetical protein